MKTRFGTTVTPIEATGKGWLKVCTEDGREREWHISEMFIEGTEPENEKAIIDLAMEQSLDVQGGAA